MKASKLYAPIHRCPVSFWSRHVALVGLVLLVGACQQTRFEALPTGDVQTCDQDWVGTWRIEDHDQARDEKEGPVYWVVAADCAQYQSIETGGISEDNDEFSLRYVMQDRNRYLVALSAPDKDAEPTAWSKGYMLVRYHFRNANEIETYAVDDHAVAKMIVDLKIPGRTDTRTRSDDRNVTIASIENLIAGPAAVTDDVLKRRGVFKRKPWLTLHRASAQEIEAVKQQAIDRRSPENG